MSSSTDGVPEDANLMASLQRPRRACHNPSRSPISLKITAFTHYITAPLCRLPTSPHLISSPRRPARGTRARTGARTPSSSRRRARWRSCLAAAGGAAQRALLPASFAVPPPLSRRAWGEPAPPAPLPAASAVASAGVGLGAARALEPLLRAAAVDDCVAVAVGRHPGAAVVAAVAGGAEARAVDAGAAPRRRAGRRGTRVAHVGGAHPAVQKHVAFARQPRPELVPGHVITEQSSPRQPSAH